jgi:hypothetical protein
VPAVPLTPDVLVRADFAGMGSVDTCVRSG